jgi:phosphate-selective porin
MAVQNVGTHNQLAVRYDAFDPNTEVGGDEIGKKGSKLNVNDAAQSAVVIAWNYFWDDAVKFTLAYDINQNEKVSTDLVTNLAAGQKPDATFAKWSKDFDNNQWTFRMQVKF